MPLDIVNVGAAVSLVKAIPGSAAQRAEAAAAAAEAAASGTVRMDQAQELTDAQKAQARANIGALVDDGVDARSLAAANDLVVYPWQEGDQTATVRGITAVRNGTRLTVNGTVESSAPAARVRMAGPIATAETAPTAAQNNADYAVTLESGHRYAASLRLISGTVTLGTAGAPYSTFYNAGATTTKAGGFITRENVATLRVYDGDGSALVLWWIGNPGDVYSNAVYEIQIVDLTRQLHADQNANLLNAVSLRDSNGRPPEWYGPAGRDFYEAQSPASGSTVVSYANGIATVTGQYYRSNSSTYYSFTNGIQKHGGSLTNSFCNPNMVLQGGRTYKITATILSGSVTGGHTTNTPRMVFYFKTSTGDCQQQTFCDNLVSATGSGSVLPATYTIIKTTTTDLTIGFGIWARSPNTSSIETYNNLKLAMKVEDITDDAISKRVTVTSATPIISAASETEYLCSAAAVTELSFTPCTSGICSVRFKSGTTATVLSLPNTVKMPSWWTGTEANRTYEISIEDGVYGVVTSWA